ncbi:MAG: HAMP domain-containing sensor histidine kinase [Chloroflexota bacterium]|nr:HAMP domain-containing sensor histidine kinase [Chloroflexota bacterium]
MTNETQVEAGEGTLAEILEGMQAVQLTLMEPPGLSPEQLNNQIQEWRALVVELTEEQVRQADRDKSDFISFVAHELRTPMTSIRGYADMLAKGTIGPVTPSQVQFIEIIIRNAERMQILLSDLQDITRIESTQLRIEMKPTTMADVLEGALQATKERIEARSQQLMVEIQADLSQVYADPARLEQALTELLRNACKYTSEKGRIRVRAWQQDRYVHCTISDTGIGISPEDQSRLFTKFFRSDNPAVREMPGTGLGLCVVKGLVELQGGGVEVESQIGEGTTFAITIPVFAEE